MPRAPTRSSTNAFAISEEAFREVCIERLTAAFGKELPWFEALVSHEFPANGIEPETLRQDVAAEVTRLLSDIGGAVAPEDVAAIRRACAVPLPQLVSLLPGAEAALREARALGLRLAICSNTFWRDDAAVADDWRAFGLADCFDAFVTSPSTGYVKPHPAMFGRALAAIDVPSAEAAILGDRLREDMAGGRAAGLRTIWLRPADAEAAPEPMPDAILESLNELTPLLQAWVS